MIPKNSESVLILYEAGVLLIAFIITLYSLMSEELSESVFLFSLFLFLVMLSTL